MSGATPGTGTDLFVHERHARENGCRVIAGVDEVGRGPFAGPVVAAAVVLPEVGIAIPVADSKVLTPGRRDLLADQLRNCPGVHIGLGVVPASRIDEINILNATAEAMGKALRNLDIEADFALVDGLPMARFPLPAAFIVRGDAVSASIAAASIIAKVHRDALMIQYDCEFPGYGFARHKGYGTREHVEALRRLGACPLHRRSYAPIARLGNNHVQLELRLDEPQTDSCRETVSTAEN